MFFLRPTVRTGITAWMFAHFNSKLALKFHVFGKGQIRIFSHLTRGRRTENLQDLGDGKVLRVLLMAPRRIAWNPLILLTLAVLALGSTNAMGADDLISAPAPIVLDQSPFPSLAGHLQSFSDESAALTIEDVAFGQAADRFLPIPGMFSAGYSTSAHWVRFAVSVPPQGVPPLLLEISPPFLDDVRVYVPRTATPQSGEDFAVTVTGDEQSFNERPIAVSTLLAPLDLPSGVTSFVYVRMTNSGTSLLHLSIQTARDAVEKTAATSLFFGSVYGTATLIALINFLFWAWLKDRMYLLYSIYSLTNVVLYPLMHGTHFYLLPETLHNVSYYGVGVFTSLNIIFGVLFAVEILRLKLLFPWIYRAALATCALACIGLVATLFRQWTPFAGIIMLSTMIMVTLFLYASVRLSLRGDVKGRLYLFAFIPLIVVVVTAVLRNVGVIEQIPFGVYSLEIAVQAHLVMMTIAMSSRIHVAEKQRMKAQEQALRISQDAQKAADALVAERTRELQSAKAKLERSLTKEQQFSRQQVQFVDMISHEFRNPLTILHDVQANLSGVISVDPVATPELQRMALALDRLNEVLDVGLRRERIDTAAMKAKFVTCNLKDLIGDAVRNILGAYPHRAIRVHGNEMGTNWTVQGDFALLKTALVNLLDNAVKYSSDDQQVEVSVRFHEETPQTILIVVEDRGSGISETQLEYVYEKYYRAPGSVDKPGAGLGLHLVQRIAEMHDGVVELARRPEGGITASLILPLAVVQDLPSLS